MDKFIDWWQRGLIAALYLSIGLLGVGPLEFFNGSGGISAWSVSRTTFFFWLIWKLLFVYYRGWPTMELGGLKLLAAPILFFAAVTVSLLPDFHQAGDYRYLFFAFMHFLMVWDLFCTHQRLQIVYGLIAWLPGVLVIRGLLYDPSVLDFAQMRRFSHPFPHPNIAGYFFSMTLPLCLATALVTTGWRRVTSMLSGAAQLFALILTYSRGSWLGWFVSILFVGGALKRREIGLVLLLFAIGVVVAPPLRARLFSLAKPGADISISERRESIGAGLKLGYQHPFFGVGYGRKRLREGLRELFGRADPETRIAHTHNVYVELFAETGIVGLGAFLWLLADGLWRSIRRAFLKDNQNSVLHLGIVASLVAVAVTGLGDVPFYHHQVRILLFTILALIYIPWESVLAVERARLKTA
jgi:O-antigen ligase